MLTTMVSNFAVKCLEATGYAGATVLMALESMIAPIPSEAVMPFAGFLVVDGHWNFWWAIGASSLGSILGSLLSYLMGYYGGKPFVLKVGKYLLLDQHHLSMAEHFFQRRSGVLTIFLSRFIPLIRHLISIPAGVGKMPLLPFLTATLIGATLWNSFLLICGMKLREHWSVVQTYSHQMDLVVGAGLLLGCGWFVKSRLNARHAR